MSEADQVLLHVQLECGALVRAEPHHQLHLGLGGELLGVQVDGEARQEAHPARRVGPQETVLPVAASGNLPIQLTESKEMGLSLVTSK